MNLFVQVIKLTYISHFRFLLKIIINKAKILEYFFQMALILQMRNNIVNIVINIKLIFKIAFPNVSTKYGMAMYFKSDFSVCCALFVDLAIWLDP